MLKTLNRNHPQRDGILQESWTKSERPWSGWQNRVYDEARCDIMARLFSLTHRSISLHNSPPLFQHPFVLMKNPSHKFNQKFSSLCCTLALVWFRNFSRGKRTWRDWEAGERKVQKVNYLFPLVVLQAAGFLPLCVLLLSSLHLTHIPQSSLCFIQKDITFKSRCIIWNLSIVSCSSCVALTSSGPAHMFHLRHQAAVWSCWVAKQKVNNSSVFEVILVLFHLL